MTTTTNVRSEREGAICLLTIDRPKALNALDEATLDELAALAAELEQAHELRAVILTGGGEKAFVAGADIAAMAELSPARAHALSLKGGALAAALESSRLPWIAAVNGFALGGGCELALSCDFIYAARGARFGQPEVNLGVIPGFGGTQRLARRVGLGKARELIFTGEVIGADEAYRIGLADQVVEAAELLPRARATAEKIAQKGPLAVAAAKRVMHAGQSLPLAEACALEAQAFALLFDSADQKEGMRAFLEKRAARFEGG
ncbi:MAG: enoyl-CoA hydratase/isomerase family protein [Myxococcales bacterium]|nr:enoyl-CoA hydratase/isomerase family protein [Myxococcales bacterium]